MAVVDQARGEGGLSEPGEGAEDLEPAAVQVVEQTDDLLALRSRAGLQVGDVDLAMAGVRVELHHLVLPVGEVRRHVLPPAAQDGRTDPPAELVEPFGILVALDRHPVGPAEPTETGEQPGGR